MSDPESLIQGPTASVLVYQLSSPGLHNRWRIIVRIGDCDKFGVEVVPMADSDELHSGSVEVEGTVPNVCIGEEKLVAEVMRTQLPKITRMEKDKFSRKSYNYKCVTCSIPL